MTDEVPAPSPAKVKPPKGPKKKVTKKAACPQHPKYIEMIVIAIKTLKERKGSSRQAIQKYVLANNKLSDNAPIHVRHALIKGVGSGTLKQIKGTGASGSFKIAEKPKIVKKPAAKKAAGAKKTAAKKPAAKKAGKKATKKPAKKAAKKAPAKKAAGAKKPVAKKPAAKKAAKKTKTAKKGKKPAKKN